MTGTEQKYYALQIMRLNDVVKDRGGVPVLLSCFGRSWGNMGGVGCPCIGFNSSCAVWPCVPCIRAFDGPLIIPYRNNSSGVYGRSMRSVYALLCYGPIGAFMLFRRSGCMVRFFGVVWLFLGVLCTVSNCPVFGSNTAFNVAVWLSVRRLGAFSVCLCIRVLVTV